MGAPRWDYQLAHRRFRVRRRRLLILDDFLGGRTGLIQRPTLTEQTSQIKLPGWQPYQAGSGLFPRLIGEHSNLPAGRGEFFFEETPPVFFWLSEHCENFLTPKGRGPPVFYILCIILLYYRTVGTAGTIDFSIANSAVAGPTHSWNGKTGRRSLPDWPKKKEREKPKGKKTNGGGGRQKGKRGGEGEKEKLPKRQRK